MRWLPLTIGALAVIVAASGSALFFVKAFDTSADESAAHQLAGRPAAEVESVLGEPDKRLEAEAFNNAERSRIAASYSPSEIPLAEGKVLIYTRKLTIILIYEKSAVVDRVYTGNT